jgi:hypothetical protein
VERELPQAGLIVFRSCATERLGAPAAAAARELEEQLGLTLVSTKGRRSWVQIEHIERPSLR